MLECFFKSPGSHFPGDLFDKDNSTMCLLLDLRGITFINPSHFFLIDPGNMMVTRYQGSLSCYSLSCIKQSLCQVLNTRIESSIILLFKKKCRKRVCGKVINSYEAKVIFVQMVTYNHFRSGTGKLNMQVENLLSVTLIDGQRLAVTRSS